VICKDNAANNFITVQYKKVNPWRISSEYYLKIQSVPQREHNTSITKISWLMLFKEIIPVVIIIQNP
jgi:hypothetical protein